MRSTSLHLALILLLALTLRLVAIDSPLVGEHSWRQADTASIARNFHEGGYRLLHPQVDWRGATPGYVESEFQAYPFLVALLYGVFGQNDVWGRGLSVFFSLLAVLFLFLLVRDHVDERSALWAAFFFAILPTSVFFGRAFMPEPLLLATSAGGLHLFSRWTRGAGAWAFAASALLVSLACLVKLTALYLGLPLLWMARARWGRRTLLMPQVWLYGAVVLLPVAAWYAHAHQLAARTGLSFGIWEYGTDKWGNWDLVSSRAYWDRILVDRMAKTHLTWAGAIVFAIGLCLERRSRGERLFDVWLLGLGVYLLVVGRGNYAHNYYQLPLLLPATVFMGKVYARYVRLDRLRTPATLALLILLVGTVAMSVDRWWKYQARGDQAEAVMIPLARAVAEHTTSEDKLIAIDDGDPTLLYLADRKGWASSLDQLRPETLRHHVRQGAVYAAGPREPGEAARDVQIAALLRAHEIVVDEAEYFVVRLRAAGTTILDIPTERP